jgi:hypothetical protein
VRWYLRYALSYRDLEEMMRERGLSIDHTTIYRIFKCRSGSCRISSGLPHRSERGSDFLRLYSFFATQPDKQLLCR